MKSASINVSELKVCELKKELQKRNSAVTGKKDELVTRLKRILKSDYLINDNDEINTDDNVTVNYSYSSDSSDVTVVQSLKKRRRNNGSRLNYFFKRIELLEQKLNFLVKENGKLRKLVGMLGENENAKTTPLLMAEVHT